MSERKAINKYYPPDYDPSQPTKKDKSLKSKGYQTVRLMTPFSMRCTKCDEFIAKSRKFNARKEQTKESYLDIKIIKLLIRCPRCNNQISFKTDPKNGTYIMESGGVKNYETKVEKANREKQNEESLEETLDRLEKEEQEELEKQRLKGEKRTKFVDIEERLAQLQKEQEDDDALESLRHKSHLLQNVDMSGLNKDDEDDERLAEEAFKKFQEESGKVERNVQENDDSDDSDGSSDDGYALAMLQPSVPQKIVKRKPASLGGIVKKPRV